MPRFIPQTELDTLLKDATSQGLRADEVVQDLVNKGHTIEGLNDPTPPKKKGIFATLSQSLQERNQAAFGTDTGIVEAAGGFSSDSALGRFATGQQGLGRTALQVAGQGAGAFGDVGAAALQLGGKSLSAVTPDSIEKPIVDTAKRTGVKILQSPAGQAGLAAIEKGMEVYGQWKEQNPADAADLEAVVNIGSMLPIGRVSQAGKQALSGVDDVAKGLGKAARESAEASVSRTLNPTTNATKATTQRIAGELVDRPLKETLSLTRKGMAKKAGAAVEVAGEAIQEAGQIPGKTATSELVDFLQSQKQQFMAGGKVVSEEGVKSIDEVTQIIAQYGEDIPNETLRDIRKIFDAEYFQGKKNIAKSTAETSKLSFKKQAADRIRGILAEASPEVAKLNKEYTFWSSLEDVLEKTVARKTGQKQFMKGLATLGGATTGTSIPSKVIGALGFNMVASLIDSPVWGFVSAKMKNKIAEKLVSSDISELGKILGSIPGSTAVQSIQEE